MELIEKAIFSASNQFKLKCYENTELICDQLLKIDPKNLEALYLSSISKYKLKKEYKVINELKKINSYESNNYLGLFYLQTENLIKSINYFTKAIEINPKMSSAWSNLGCQFRAIKKNKFSNRIFRKSKKIRQ